MSASTAAREARKKPGLLESYAMGAVKINKGTLVSLRATDGFLYPARSGAATDQFVGVAYEGADNSAGMAGAVAIRVEKSGSYVVAKVSAVQTDLGGAFYASDDQTVTATPTNNQLVGYACELIDGANLRVRIDRAVQ